MIYIQKTVEGIFQNAPIWVWPLLVLLIYIGWKETKTRDVSKIYFYCLPLFCLIGVSSIMNLEHQNLAYLSSFICMVLGAIYGFYFQRKRILGIQGNRVKIQGEWLTLLVLMIIFFSNFAKGVMSAVTPEWLLLPAYTVLFAAIIGTSNGTFFGRSISVLRAKP